MFIIDNIYIEDEILKEGFRCDVSLCKGACCVEGEGGAPVETHEKVILEEIYEKVAPFLRQESREAILQYGTTVEIADGEFEAPLLNGKECVYVVFEKGIAVCGIEKAYRAGVIDFPKPVSCHLYPIRVYFKAGNYYIVYHQWEICQTACKPKVHKGMKIYEFVAEALERKFGAEFVGVLQAMAQELSEGK